jgi:peptidoglycan/LPS O-acetylase OafA/YrhL
MGHNRSNMLDLIRGLAIWMVVSFHYFPNRVANIGWTGVNLFFILSGFLMAGILIDNRAAQNYYLTFYARRAFRILPLYAINVMLFAAIIGLDQPLWHYVLFLQNFTWIAQGNVGHPWIEPTWSLAVEEQFYLLLPLLIRITPLKCLPYVSGALIVAAPAYRLFVTQWLGVRWPAANEVLPGCLDSLFLGVFIAWAIRDRRALEILRTHHNFLWALSGLGILGVMALVLLAPSPTSWVGVSSMSWIALTYALIFAGLVTQFQSSPKERGPLCWLGIGAYSIYLFHKPVALAVEKLGFSDVVDHAIALPILAVGAAFFWYAVERPLIAFARRRWQYRTRFQTAPMSISSSVPQPNRSLV